MNALVQDARYRLRQVARSYRRQLAHVEHQVADQLAQLEAHRSHPLMQPPILAELDRLQAQASTSAGCATASTHTPLSA